MADDRVIAHEALEAALDDAARYRNLWRVWRAAMLPEVRTWRDGDPRNAEFSWRAGLKDRGPDDVEGNGGTEAEAIDDLFGVLEPGHDDWVRLVGDIVRNEAGGG